ncbi:hypothetical protein VPHD528_0142 [Vibrio phage D528]
MQLANCSSKKDLMKKLLALALLAVSPLASAEMESVCTALNPSSSAPVQFGVFSINVVGNPNNEVVLGINTSGRTRRDMSYQVVIQEGEEREIATAKNLYSVTALYTKPDIIHVCRSYFH